MVVVLDRAQIDARKDSEPGDEAHFRILVADDDTARALATLHAEGLPRPNPAGVLTSVDRSALVPSRAAEHAQVLAGLAGDLERTLESVDGVSVARVHLNVPEADPLRNGPSVKATASVLIEHRDGAPALRTEDVQRLVAGGVAGLAAPDVAVVTVEGARAQADEGSTFVHVGPIAVARSSARLLHVAFAVFLMLLAALAAITLVLASRLTRERQRNAGREGAG